MLITLVIIGVIAAITIPSLVANSNKEETLSKLKKSYSTLAQAIMRSQSDNGPVEDWYSDVDMNATEYFNQYFKPYLQINNICMSGQQCGYSSNTPWKYLNGDKYDWLLSSTSSSSRMLFNLADGTFVTVRTGSSQCVEYDENGKCINSEIVHSSEPHIIVDINGSKKPNILGRDVFFMHINNNLGVIPLCYSYTKANVNQDCKKGGKGNCCLKKIMNDSWNFSDNYPI